MKSYLTIIIFILILSFLFSGCGMTEKFSKKSSIENSTSAGDEKVTFKCTYCQSDIDVTGLEKGCDVRCPACNNACTY